jgi:hypothetical protein
MEQTTIQAWIERIVQHIKKVKDLENENKYKGGRLKGKKKRRVH